VPTRGHFLWTRSDGRAFTANDDELPLSNTLITLVRYDFPSSGYYYYYYHVEEEEGLIDEVLLFGKIYRGGWKTHVCQDGSGMEEWDWQHNGGRTVANDQIWFLQANTPVSMTTTT